MSGTRAYTLSAVVAIRLLSIAEHRTQTTPFDIVVEGKTPGDDPAQANAIVQPFAEAGATWWMEAMWSEPNGLDDLRARIRQGPPRVDESYQIRLMKDT
jgi:hypothetical protein